MNHAVPVVDLFSGPGGLGEGFGALKDRAGRPVFRIAMSVEKDRDAFRTLRLRAFLRQFGEFPREYYRFLDDPKAEAPDWVALYPRHWGAACHETARLTLGTPEAERQLAERAKLLRTLHDGRTVLLGGPPCQAYSVIGRARNAGSATYRAQDDDRLWLYRSYVRVLDKLRPLVAVMENVQGLLSARSAGEHIFPKVLASLRGAGVAERERER